MRLIDADALIEELSGKYIVPVDEATKGVVAFMGTQTRQAINNAPTIDAEQPKNVFVFRSNIFFKHDDIKVMRDIIKQQIEEGVVVVPRYLTLEAVTGPCTDVEVIIEQEGQP